MTTPAIIYVDGEPLPDPYAEDIERVQVSFPPEDGDTFAAVDIDAAMAQAESDLDHDPAAARAVTLVRYLEDDPSDDRAAAELRDNFPNIYAALNYPTGPGTWCNSAAISIDERDDAVHVSISVGDPRGAFVMTVRKLPDGTLVMHLPYPGMGMAHAGLSELHPGTFKVGS